MPDTAVQGALTHKRILTVALPIVIANASVPILGAVDTGVVGQLGQAAPIGAVGIGAIILSAIYWIFGFLRMGTVGLAGQAQGAGDHGEVRAFLFRALLIGFTGGVLLILLQIPIFGASFMISPASEEVEGMAREYMGIRIYSAPAAIALYGITGWLIALERTGAVLAIQLFMNGLNILLDLIFVLGFGWDVSGVAVATFIAEWGGLALGLWFCFAGMQVRLRQVWARVFDVQKLRHMMSVNFDILIRSVLLQIAFVSFLLLGSDLGDDTLAANQVLLQFLHITAYAMDGFAFAAEAFVAQAFGAGAIAQVRRTAVMTSLWGAGICLLLALLFYLIGPQIVALMAKSKQVQAEANIYLIWMVFAPLTGCAAWMLDGIFIGATRSQDMRNMMFASFVIYAGCIFVFLPLYENHGLWLALNIFFIARGATLALRYKALERAALRP